MSSAGRCSALACLSLAAGCPSAAAPTSAPTPPARAGVDEAAPARPAAPVGSCSKDGWCWQQPRPHGEHLYAVWGTAADDVYAVGEDGIVVHFDGTAWTRMASGTENQLVSIWGSGPDDVHVGGRWVTLHFDGRAWSAAHDDDHWFSGLWGFEDGPVFAVTPADRVWASDDGRAWSEQRVHRGYLTSVWGPNPEHLVVVGGHGLLLRRDGAAWTPTPIAVDGIDDLTLNDVWGTDDGQLFVATDVGALHFDGDAWTSTVAGEEEIMFSIWGSGPDDIVAVGDAIMEYDGKAWSTTMPEHQARLRSVWGSDADHVFAVGECGTVMLREEGRWSTLTETGSARLVDVLGLEAIWGFGSDHLVAVGTEVLRWDGAAWTHEDPSSSGLLAVWASSESDVFATSATGKVLHYDGRAWSEHTTGSRLPLNAVWGTGPSDVFAVGNAGRIVHFDGSSWTTQPSGTRTFLEAVWAAAPDDVWASGDEGTLLHYDGSQWTSVATPVSSTIDAVWGSGPDDVLAVGDGVLLHYDGTAWSALASVPEPLREATRHGPRSLWGNGPDDITLAAGDGALFHYDGTTWSPQDVGTATDLHGVWTGPSGEAFVVGRCGAILHRAPS